MHCRPLAGPKESLNQFNLKAKLEQIEYLILFKFRGPLQYNTGIKRLLFQKPTYLHRGGVCGLMRSVYIIAEMIDQRMAACTGGQIC